VPHGNCVFHDGCMGVNVKEPIECFLQETRTKAHITWIGSLNIFLERVHFVREGSPVRLDPIDK
jgi:hypothetical protein